MLDFLKGISFISILSVIYKTLGMLTAQKTETVFYTIAKSKLAEIIKFLYLFIAFNIGIFFCPLSFDMLKPNLRVIVIIVSVLIILILMIIFVNMYNFFKFKKLKKLMKIINKYYYNNYFWIALFCVFLFCGILVMLFFERNTNSFYEHYKNALGLSVFYSIISISIFYLYLSDYNNMIRQVCWVEYKEANETEVVRYYIFYASDSEYIVCGKNDKYENNNEFRFINIKELKDKYIIHIEKINEA